MIGFKKTFNRVECRDGDGWFEYECLIAGPKNFWWENVASFHTGRSQLRWINSDFWFPGWWGYGRWIPYIARELISVILEFPSQKWETAFWKKAWTRRVLPPFWWAIPPHRLWAPLFFQIFQNRPRLSIWPYSNNPALPVWPHEYPGKTPKAWSSAEMLQLQDRYARCCRYSNVFAEKPELRVVQAFCEQNVVFLASACRTAEVYFEESR